MSLFLFDLDGTLIGGLGPYEASLQKAITEVFGRQVEIDLIQFHGLTDREILYQTLQQHNFSVPERKQDTEFEEKIDHCLALFGKCYQATSEVKMISEARETLNKLNNIHVLGIVTGNVEQMARKKLALFNMNQYLSFGAFGQESYNRGDLVTLALSRATIKGWKKHELAYIVGDTPRDIEAGKAVGIHTIAVTTGRASCPDLLAANPDYITKNLSSLLLLA